MRRTTRLALAAAALVATAAALAAPKRLPYPVTKTVDQTDVLHGVSVPDPYRWLETDVRESKDVEAWVAAENEVTFAYLEGIPSRPAIGKRLKELWNYERVTAPAKAGGRYFFRKNDGLQAQSVLYVRESLAQPPRLLVDPNGWSKDGTVALASTVPSEDGRLLAYGVAEAGSDWQTWRVMDVDSGTVLPDELKWVKFSGASWTPDGKGFFYARYPEPAKGAAFQSLNTNQKVYYHRVGTPQAQDVLVYARPDHPDWGFGAGVTDDGRYLTISAWKASGNRTQVFVRDLSEPYAGTVHLVGEFDQEYALVDNDGPVFFFKTDLDAPRGRVVAIDLAHPERSAWREVIPQSTAALQSVTSVGRLLVARYLEDARTVVKLFGRDGKLVRTVDLPGIGSAYGFGGRASDSETFFSFQSYTTPPTIYRYDVATGERSVLAAAKVPFDPSGYQVEQVFVTSKDGTKVPVFLTHRKGMKRDGSNPTLMYGYGGFRAAETPRFSPATVAWLEMGGVYADVCLRGGSEYGEAWHEAGTKLKKQNVFDDFVAAAEWLVAQKVSSPARLAMSGASNGGLLVGAVMTQRPELFAAALPAVGVMDMLRFHRFTAGRFWVEDYGSADDPAQFKALLAYSPYHNLRKGTRYPATLVTTADHDDRVVPGHSFKFAAALQAAQAGEKPVLIRIETRAGHGGGKPTAKVIEETADEWAFLAENLGMRLPAGLGGK